MPVSINTEEHTSTFTCNCCGVSQSTFRPDGVAPVDWGTGQLSIDNGLSVIYQIPLFFCPDHTVTFLQGATVALEGPVKVKEPEDELRA